MPLMDKLIEEMIDNHLSVALLNDKFITEIKEVPYGRHNSDPDYRGSGTELS